ncbi:hypothetical protein GQ55_5G216300 [Panicum hallii var. hallii]|uniref:Uncharacterized protein n=1 Tax=Panicum hallii var. hallii TaxID=1504633 RepID=A0A2T7DIT7_9POAL|nr:hypothetical protein GQ55_5G216300 [Panicum hallii var. hallii]
MLYLTNDLAASKVGALLLISFFLFCSTKFPCMIFLKKNPCMIGSCMILTWVVLSPCLNLAAWR